MSAALRTQLAIVPCEVCEKHPASRYRVSNEGGGKLTCRTWAVCKRCYLAGVDGNGTRFEADSYADPHAKHGPTAYRGIK